MMPKATIERPRIGVGRELDVQGCASAEQQLPCGSMYAGTDRQASQWSCESGVERAKAGREGGRYVGWNGGLEGG